MTFLLNLFAATRSLIRPGHRSAMRAFAAALGLVLMLACGGGGGGGGGSSDPGLTVSPASLTFTARQGDPAPASQSLHITVTSSNAAYVGADWGGGAGPSWLTNTGFTGAGRSWSLGLQITDTSLPPGTYTATVRAGIANSNGEVIGTQNATITYRVYGSFNASPNALSIDYVQGQPAPAAQTISLNGSAGNWTATADKSWIHLGSASGTTPGALSVTVDPTGLPVGDQSGIVTFRITSDGSTVQIPVTLHVAGPTLQSSAGVLTYGGNHGGALAAQPLTLTMNTGDAITWTATADDAWVVLSKASGTTPDTLSVSVNPAIGPVTGGSYHSRIHFSGTDHGQAVARTVDVDLTLGPANLVASTSGLTFGGVNGEALPSQAIDLGMNNAQALAWTATASDSWILLSKTSGTLSDQITVHADPSHGPLASGTYSGTVTFHANYMGTSLSKVVNVSLSLTQPVLSLSLSSLVLGGPAGRDLSALPLSLTLNTGAGSYPWTATTSNGWIHANQVSGSVSGTSTTLNLSPDTTGLTGGTFQGHIDFSATVNGDTVTASLPVTLNLESHRLLASDTGVAFASMPGRSMLSRTLQMRDNLGKTTAWTASSDQAWLSVTASGTTGSALVLTANPSGLAVDALHRATVTIASPDTTVEGTETIEVGLWLGSAAPVAMTEAGPGYTTVAMDPIRPYVYAHTGGTDITVFNVFTGTVARTISMVGPQLGSMAVSNSGDRLFVVDKTNFKVISLNLSNDAIAAPWPLGSPYSVDITYGRVGGRELLFTTAGTALRCDSGAQIDVPTPFYGTCLAVSLDGSRLCAGAFNGNSSVWTCPIDITSLGGEHLIMGEIKSQYSSGYGGDVVANAWGSRIYAASSGGDAFYAFDTTAVGPWMPLLQALPSEIHPANVEVAKDGRIFCGASPIYGTHDLWIYREDGTPLAAFMVAGYARIQIPGTLKVTGDGLGAAVVTAEPGSTNPKLMLLAVAP